MTDVQICGVAFSPDGLRMVSGGEDGALRLWTSDGKAIAVFKGHTGPACTVAFSPDGRRIASGSQDKTVRLWTSDGKAIAVLTGHMGAVLSVAFSADGTRIASGGQDYTVRLWTTAGHPIAEPFTGHSGPVLGVAFSSDGTRIASGSRDQTVRFWSLLGEPVAEPYKLFGRPVSSIALSSDGNLLAAGDEGGTIVWLSLYPKPVLFPRPNAHQGAVAKIAFSRDGMRVVSAGLADGLVRLWILPDVAGVINFSPPVVRDIASSNAGVLWLVGSDGYAAYSADGRDWSPVNPGDTIDLIAVKVIGADAAIALTANNTLALFGKVSQEQQQQQAVTTSFLRTVNIPIEDKRLRLRTLTFLNANEGWVAGDGGLILHTTDGGRTWSKLYAKDGLALTGIHIETPSGVGWAVGKHADGRQTIIAANSAGVKEGAADGWRELPHYLATWYFFFGIPALLLSGLLLIRAWRADPAPPQQSIEEVATSDQPLRWNEPDARSLKPLARSLSRFLRNINTQPPLTLAITGRWGSGKSSLMNLLMSDLQRYGGRAVWFNAWHHREEEHLLAALFEAIRREAPPGWWSWPGLVFRARLLWMRSKRQVINLVYCALFVGIALLTVRVALNDDPKDVDRIAERVIGFFGNDVAESGRAALSLALAGSGGLALLALRLRGKLVALPANPAKLVFALARRASLGDFSDKLAFRHRFGEQFRDVCSALLTRTSPGLVILIDDLDRCPPGDVLKILEAVNYLVSVGPCIVVLGMDRRQIEYCVGLGFEKLVEGLPEDELIYASDETPDKSGKQRAFARHYLEKLINIEVPVPALDDAATDALLFRSIQLENARDDDAPAWLYATKRLSQAGFQIARVGLFAYLAGIFLMWGTERLRQPYANPTSTTTAAVVGAGVSSSTPPPASVVQPPKGEIFNLAHVDLTKTANPTELPGSGQWLYWAPTVFLIGITFLFGVAVAVHRQRQIVQDSPRFAKAMQAVKPLLAAINATPRAIKRYQNRMRYLAARLRPAIYEPDWIDSLLHWLGLRLRHPLVPAAWFQEGSRPVIDEPALILLGAIELFAPKAFSRPAELFVQLESGTPGDKLTDQQVEAWTKVRNGFSAQGLVMPTTVEVARYATFVQTTARKASGHLAEIVPFSRDTTERG
ncbi:P-loop NTPase fold protein [Bradyrhizobium sp. RT6a]|uniref:P-loop NTPase fold protein n=1 Tax=Bradyrhizobium sp. RT6a TaxID=3156381 RepID=UPI0033939BE6